MPNWCGNTVIIDGGEREIARFIKYVENASIETTFSFQAILPMPEELQGTSSPANIVTQEEYDKYEPPSTDIGVGRPITQEMVVRFRKQYDADNWYDWASDNWGTKWDVRGEDIEASLEPTHLVYKFETAWGPPPEIYEELVKQFPKLTINWHYHEENMELFGNLATDTSGTHKSSKEVNTKIATMLRGLKKERNNAQI